MRMWKIVVLLGVAVIGRGAAAQAAPSVGEILERVVATYGGQETLSQFPGFRARGKVLSMTDGINGTLRVSLDVAGTGLRVEIEYPHRTEVRIVSHGLAWNGRPERQRPSKPPMARSMRLQFHRLAAPFELAQASADSLIYEGTSQEGWHALRRVWSDTAQTIYEVDFESGRILRIRGEVLRDDGPLAFTTESSDFRDVDGVLFPFRMTTWVGEDITAETILDRVRIVEKFPKRTFAPEGRNQSDI